MKRGRVLRGNIVIFRHSKGHLLIVSYQWHGRVPNHTHYISWIPLTPESPPPPLCFEVGYIFSKILWTLHTQVMWLLSPDEVIQCVTSLLSLIRKSTPTEIITDKVVYLVVCALFSGLRRFLRAEAQRAYQISPSALCVCVCVYSVSERKLHLVSTMM